MGITYFFEHHDDGHTLVFADSATAFGPIAGDANVRFVPAAGGLVSGDHVSLFRAAEQISSDESTLRDYDFKKPDLLVEGTAAAEVLPEPRPTRMPFCTYLTAAAAANCFSESWDMEASLKGTVPASQSGTVSIITRFRRPLAPRVENLCGTSGVLCRLSLRESSVPLFTSPQRQQGKGYAHTLWSPCVQ